MPLPERDHNISKEEKAELIKNFEAMEIAKGREATIHTKHRFHASQVRALLSDKNVVEFAVEKGVDEDGAEVIILTAYDANGVETEDTLERGVPCPPICG